MNNDAITRSNAISRSAALSMMDKYIDMARDDEMHHAMCVVAEGLAELPVLDVAPVVHGEFARLPEEVIPCLHVDPVLCKTCNTTFFTFNKEGKRLMFCPYCGARYFAERKDGEADV